MEQLLQTLLGLFPQLEGPWRYVVPAAALVVVVAPKVADLFREFVDFRLGRRRLEIEKLRLEVLKLRMELEPKGVAPGAIPQWRPDQVGVTVAPPVPARPSRPDGRVEPRKEVPGWIQKWVERFPRSGKVLVFLLQILLAYLAFSFGLVTVAVPFIAWQDKGSDLGGLIGAFLIYGGLTYLCYKGFARIRTARKALQSATINEVAELVRPVT